jgi:uncharacterized protein (TIGR03437 family)
MRCVPVLLFLPVCAAQSLSPSSPINKLAVDSSGAIYAAQGSTITKVNQWTATLPFPVEALNVTANLIAAGPGGIVQIDTGTGKILSSTSFTLPAGTMPTSMAITPAGNIVVSSDSTLVTPGALNIASVSGSLMKLDPTGRVLWAAQGVGGAIAVDSAENIYVAGNDNAAKFPTTANAFQTTASFSLCATTGGLLSFGFPCAQQYIAKVSPDGSTLLFSTYLTGTLGAYAADIALGPDGSIYTAGSVQATNYPVTAGALIDTYPAQFLDSLCSCIIPALSYSSSGFLSRLSADGSQLLYSTFLGGSQSDRPSAIAVGKDGSMVVAGVAFSPDFPGLPQQIDICKPGNSLLNTKSRDFLMRISADGSNIASAQLIGGTNTGGIACITDAADTSFADTVSPGELITINGFSVGPTISEVPGLDNPVMQIGGVTVTFDGIPALLTAAGGTLVTAAVPFAIAGQQQTTLTLLQNGQPFDSRTLNVTAATPSMFVLPPNGKTCNANPQVQYGSFTGGSPAPAPLILNPDGTINACDNPAPRGSSVTFFLNGLGVSPPQLTVGAQSVTAIPFANQIAVSAVSFELLLLSTNANLVTFVVRDGNTTVPDYQPNYGIPVYVK